MAKVKIAKKLGTAVKDLRDLVKKMTKKSKSKTKAAKPKPKKDTPKGKKNKKSAKTAERKENITKKMGGFKGRIVKLLGAGTIGGLFGGLLSGADKSQKAVDDVAEPGKPQPQQTTTERTTGDDPFIDISAAAAGFVAALQSAVSIDRESNEEKAISASNIVVLEDIALDEEGGYPFIESGTLIPARIAEIGVLFSITDKLNGRMDDVYKRVFILDSTLKELAKQLDIAIDANAATARANERRRDEEDVESGISKTKAAVIGATALVALASYNKISALAMRALKIATLGAISLFADDVAAMMTDDIQEPEVDEEAEAIIEQQMTELDETDDQKLLEDKEEAEEENDFSAIDSAIESYEKYFEDDLVAGSLGSASLIASGAGIIATAAGATTAAPVLGVAAAITGAAALGYGVGNMIADNTQIDEKIGEAIAYAVGNRSIEDVASDQEMNEKFGDKRGAALLGDLLGEGMFDMAEEPREIIAAFKDIDTQKKLWALEDDYEQLYGRTLDEALLDVVGTKGLESIDNFVTTNIINKKKLEKITGVVEEPILIPNLIIDSTETDDAEPIIIPNTEIYENVEPLVPISTEIAGIPIEQFLTTEIDNSNKLETLVDNSVESQMSTIMPIVMKQVQKAQRDSFPAGTTPPIRYESATPTFRSIDPFLNRSAVT